MPRRRIRKFSGSITQRYLSYESEGERFRLPMLSVRLKGPSGSFRTAALVDSGSTATFIPPEFARIIGLEKGEESEATGAGGKFRTRLVTATIEILKSGLVIEAEVHVPVKEGRIPYAILGRDTIFLRYDITFRENRNLFVLRRPKR